MAPRQQVIEDAYKLLEADFPNSEAPQESEIRSRTVIYATNGPFDSYIVEFEYNNEKWNACTINGIKI
jgi:hypothetical protein